MFGVLSAAGLLIVIKVPKRQLGQLKVDQTRFSRRQFFAFLIADMQLAKNCLAYCAWLG